MKIFSALIVGVVVILGAAWGIALKFRGATALAVTTVRTEPVERGDLVEVVAAPGIVVPKTRVSISAKVAARIIELPFDEGDIVTAGKPDANPPVPASVLVRLDAKDLEAQLRAAQARYDAQSAQIQVADARILAQQAQIEASKVMLTDAQRDLGRQKELLASQDVSQSVVDEAQTKVDQLDAQLEAARRELDANRVNLQVMKHELEAARAEIDRARDTLSYTTILSPIDGVVTRLNAKVGELVVTGTMNNPGTVIMEVADLSVMLVEARVDESNIAQVKVGQHARVMMQAYGDDIFSGTVRSVALASTDAKDGSKYYEAEIQLNTGGRRIPTGLTADVEIETQHHRDVLKVPSQAVVGRPVDELPPEVRNKPQVDQAKTLATVVFRYDAAAGKAIATPVEVGPSDMTHTILLSGIDAGEPVITGPYKVLESLKHEQAVKPEQPATQPATQPSTRPASSPTSRRFHFGQKLILALCRSAKITTTPGR